MTVGALLLLPAVAAFTVGGPGSCRRLCWVYDLTAHLMSPGAANVLHSLLWLALAAAFVVVGFRMKLRKGA
jgi:hypothetical protein